MAREMTSGELAAIRSKNQFSKLYLAVHNPTVVFSCRVNQAFTTKDKVVQITYDAPTGDYTDVIPGMTVWLGTTAGAWDAGQVRVRKAASSSILYVGENSDVFWADDLYATVVDEFSIWARHPRVLADTSVYMDYDVEYTDQHDDCAPVPVIGTHKCLWLTGESVSVDLDASNSWCPSAGEMTFLWESTGGSLSGETTATPTFTADAAGVYRIDCSVTVGGATTTGRRYIFVYDAENQPFKPSLKSEPSGSYDNGGWEFSVGIVGPADQSIIRDRALAILFSMDFYDGIEASLGPIAGSENIKVVGYINGESINVNPVESTVAFEVKGPHAQIEALEEFIDGIEDTAGTPDAWTEIKNLTIDKCVWHLITWRSTISTAMDVYPSGDTRQALMLQSGEGNLMSQINDNASAIAAKACCDRLGRMFIEVNLQMVPVSDRAGVPEVLELTKKDWTGAISITRNVQPKTSQVILSGVHYETGTEGSAIFSLAPGHVFKRFGSTLSIERLLLESQSKANELAGLVLGWNNHEYDFEINTSGNNGMVDICPAQYVKLDISSADNSRGIPFAGRMIVREITMLFDSKTSAISYQWVGESESFPENNVDGDVPSESVDDWDSSVPPLPSLPPLPPLPVVYPPPSAVPTNQPKVVIGASSTHGVIYTEDFDAEMPTWFFMNNGLSELDKLDIAQLIVTPGGMVYILTESDGISGYRKVMVADRIGGTWRTLFSYTDYPQEGSAIYGIGYNPLQLDTIAIFGGRPWSWPYDGNIGESVLAIGNSASVSIAAGSNHEYLRDNFATVLYIKGGWKVFHSNGTGILGSYSSPCITLYSSTGAMLDTVIDDFNAGQGGQSRFGASPMTQDFAFQWDGGGFAGYAEVVGNSAVWKTGFDPQTVQGLSFSPSGTHAMGSDGSTPYKTVDAGVNWTSMAATIPIGSDVWENCRDDYRWIFGGGVAVKLTMDAGVTAPLDKMGNLPTIAALIDITHLRFIE